MILIMSSGTLPHLNFVHDCLGFVFHLLHRSFDLLSRLGTNCYLRQHLSKGINDELKINNDAASQILSWPACQA